MKPQQQWLGKDFAPPAIPAIDQAAHKYEELRDERMRVAEKEADAHATLLALLQQHKLTTYIFDDRRVWIEPGEPKVRVRVLAPEEVP
jgi:hypothetical protein